jgi:hypothetical protein
MTILVVLRCEAYWCFPPCGEAIIHNEVTASDTEMMSSDIEMIESVPEIIC